MKVLHDLICAYKGEGIPVILDAKRGDIGKTSAAYADAAFNVYGADAVTVSPWMGTDSVGPFLEHPTGNGVYLLLRTSNKGAADFQDMPVAGKPAFFSVAGKILEWDNGNLGAVVGATRPEELERITAFFAEAKHEILPHPGSFHSGSSRRSRRRRENRPASDFEWRRKAQVPCSQQFER